jgi:hypothetical protein
LQHQFFLADIGTYTAGETASSTKVRGELDISSKRVPKAGPSESKAVAVLLFVQRASFDFVA